MYQGQIPFKQHMGYVIYLYQTLSEGHATRLLLIFVKGSESVS